jgi:hypothetical protein
MKIGMIRKYEDAQSLSVLTHESGFAVSATDTIFKDAACIKERANFIFH